jgi:SagB-type dehydrogenase family enzyme
MGVTGMQKTIGGKTMKTFAPVSCRTALAVLLICVLCLGGVSCAGAGGQVAPDPGNLEVIRLPKPQIDNDCTLGKALRERRSIRSLDNEKKLPPQVLSNLLWAAWGINRPDSGKRTAPSAMNWQEIDLYVALEQGLYLYDAGEHALKPVLARDVRAETGRFFQPFVAKAPVNLVYVADFSRVSLTGKMAVSEEEKRIYSAATTGAIVQNVYLFCAAEGLGTVVRGLFNQSALRSSMGLRENQQILLAQTVGYPAP